MEIKDILNFLYREYVIVYTLDGRRAKDCLFYYPNPLSKSDKFCVYNNIFSSDEVYEIRITKGGIEIFILAK